MARLEEQAQAGLLKFHSNSNGLFFELRKSEEPDV